VSGWMEKWFSGKDGLFMVRSPYEKMKI